MFPWNLFPFNDNMKKMMDNVKPNEIEKYTKEIMSKMLPNYADGMMNPQELLRGIFPNTTNPTSTSNSPSSNQQSSLQTSIFETHEYIYVRITIKSEEWLREMKLYHTANLMIIEHIPHSEDKHTLTLPAIVKKKGATANYKDGTLEIKIPKSVDMQFCEIDVTETL
ncbi:MAG: component of the spore coat GerT [Bacillus sp. (in: firmicutes)]|nr:component of the spore coat GerT [Bacillus sp. (in: firmicutes)]